MIKCPRCAQMVDETIRTTCPLCFTPIQAATDAAKPLEEGTLAASPVPLTADSVQPLSAAPPNLAGAQTVNPLAPSAVVQPLNGVAQPLTGVQPLNGTQPLNAPTAPLAPSLNAPASGGTSSLPPLAMEPGLAPGTIRTLNGDIIQTGAPAPTVAPAAGGPPPMGGAAIPTDGSTGPTSNRFSTMYDEPPEDKRGILHTLHGLLVAAMLIGAAGWLIWKIAIPKPGPKDQVQRFLTAVGDSDFKTIYDVTDLSDDQKKQYPDLQTFADDAKKKLDQVKATPFGPMLTDIQKSLKTGKVGDAKIDNDTATVPVSFTFTFLGQTQTVSQDVSLKQVDGEWKISGNGSGSKIPGVGGNFDVGGGGGGGFTGRAGGG